MKLGNQIIGHLIIGTLMKMLTYCIATGILSIIARVVVSLSWGYRAIASYEVVP